MSDSELYRMARKRSRRKFWKLTLFTVFLLYPGVSSVIFSLFVCKEVDGVDYMVTDFTIRCHDDRWFKFLGPAVVMILIYPVGVPAFMFYLLRRYRKRLMSAAVRVQLGFLYEAYNLEMWYFELVDMAHKLIMTSLLAFMDVSFQMPAGMIVATIYLGIILLGRPYLRKGDDRLHLFAQTEIYLIVLAGFILFDSAAVGLDERTDILLSTVMIMLTVGVFLAFLIMAFMNVKKIVRNFQRDRREKKLAAINAERIARGEEPLEGGKRKGKKGQGKSKKELTDEKVAELANMKTTWAS